MLICRYNGAGKSTLINILCGVLSATEGSVNVFGLDAKKDRYTIASKTGICAQVDILYDSLTTYEHLYYFGLMRGVPNSLIKDTIDKMVLELKMEQMLKQISSVLSGGQKRKLCVALAFIHEPELVVLDEMSSGMDPENRRIVWDFLSRQKKNKAILLCTHFMDEGTRLFLILADVLSRRKAILTRGQVVSVGTSEFLKQIYNTGYTAAFERGDLEVGVEELVAWFASKSIPASFKKQSTEVLEFNFSSEYLSFVNDFEKDPISAKFKSFSIKENGLEQIFSSKDLVKESDLKSTPEERDLLLKHIQSFKDPSFVTKTAKFMSFEMKRTLVNLPIIIGRMTIAILLVVVLWLVTFSANASINTVDSVKIDENFINNLVPKGLVLETNSTILDSSSDQLVPFDKLGNGISMGRISQINSSGYRLVIGDGYIGGTFLAVQSILPTSNIETTFEFIQTGKGSGIQNGAGLIIVAIIISQIFSDLLLLLSDEILESREKIKFLLLASGVPLSSYWIVTLTRNFILTLPFIIAVAVVIPPDFILSPFYVVIYLLSVVFFSAAIGTSFEPSVARTIIQCIRYLGFISLITVKLVVVLARLSFTVFDVTQAIYVYFAPFGPFAAIGETFFPAPGTTATTLLIIALVYLVLYICMLCYAELNHRLVKVINPNPASGYVSFTNLSKSFGWRTKKVAVKNLNFDVQKNELFALLGPNGCGKTTTLSMLTAQQRPTSGSVHVNKKHALPNKLEIIADIGYCPQFDGLLIPTMTVADHLRLFCFMNGIEQVIAEEYIDLLLRAFGISPFKDVRCGNLSGGTKRKVSAAIAVMLPRSLVVLDEASSGLDPLARQKLWNTVSLLNKNRTTIMTTHYINETSACDRIAIMAEGNLRAVDTEHNLAKAYAKGYKASLHFNQQGIDVMGFVHEHLFPEGNAGVTVENVVGDVAVVNFQSFNITLGTLVSRLTGAQENGLLKTFTIGRMALEDVFLDLVKTIEKV